MTFEEAQSLIRSIQEEIFSRLDGDHGQEEAAVKNASGQLEQFGRMGGNTRTLAEIEILRLLKSFDTTRENMLAQPVSSFFLQKEEEGERYKQALKRILKSQETQSLQDFQSACAHASTLLEGEKT